ncbi:alpha/beta hydrolase [Hydrogenivirga sp. 128-5-R1-1]|uniref:alpha/beta fold hydrolase n=1 Tax=Hydrogenivirga sp. 128-5-R1-1 TaxID=392423 RepID=UPI00015F36E9|nr:alpha/beta hydrolase [Hydrogenivirga sp. 128-5-R1-1]EDP74585.1 hypothetical protein HG1285_12772 [Hydrogenivirga sp. 128-5-R1-1]
MELLSPVFIHGWAFSSRVFNRCRGIKVELPGHGRNTEPYKNLESVVESLALSLPGRHDIVGWSLGGTLALMLAMKYPAKVNRLFLIGTSPYFGGAWSERNLRAFKLRIKREGVGAFRKMAYPKSFEDRLSEETALRMLEDFIKTDLRCRLPLLRKKTLIVHGERDVITPVKEALKLYNLVKGSKLIILPGGHFPAEDETGLLSTLLKVGRDL